jgi:SAM-dependent methyltransferase
MPVMSRFEAVLCRSGPWRGFARRAVLPWALQGIRPEGDVLEIGAGSGAMAAEVLRNHRSVRMTATDVDPSMVESAAERLAPFGDRAVVRLADGTALPFGAGEFDLVLSWIMLHHTVRWEETLAAALRVLRPGGSLVGYDLVASAPLRALHRGDDTHRFVRVGELRDAVRSLPVAQAVLTPSLAGFAVRFTLRKG